MRRTVAGSILVGLLLLLAAERAGAHAALVASDPLAGSTVEAAPTTVRLTFSEDPEASLSSIRIVDGHGAAQQLGSVQAGPGEGPEQPRQSGRQGPSLQVGLRPLERGSYTVVWRTVSRVDGHPTAGVFTFGVGVAAEAAAAGAAPASAPPWTELVGRAALVAGLIGLLGTAGAAVGRFGAATGGGLALASWATSLLGLLLLADGQRRNAATSFGQLWETPAGRSLAWRAIAIVVAGVALAVGRRSSPTGRRLAMGVVAGATAAAMAVEVAAGHAAGASSWRGLVVAAQWAHFVAAGVWLGGLVALLLDVRWARAARQSGGLRAPTGAKAEAVRRFSRLALSALALVVVTGTLRALGELSAWGQLTATGYGRAVLAKIFLVVAIVALAAVNRRSGVPQAQRSLARLRALSMGEIVLGAGAVTAAAILASLAPPVNASATSARGLRVTGADFATTVKATLTVHPGAPGLNAFRLRIVDYDSGDPEAADAVSLRFVAVDDVGLPPTTLELRAAGMGTWTASGANLSLDGRWEVTALARRGAGSILVPLAVDVPGPPQFLSVQALAGEPVKYTVQLGRGGFLRIWADPQQPGPTTLHAALFDPNGDPRPGDHALITTTANGEPTRQHATTAAGLGEFTADVALAPGETTVAVIARTADGTRARASVDLEVHE